LALTEHQNQCFKIARAAEARLRTLTMTYRVARESVWAYQMASIKPAALYRSELWCGPNIGGGQDDLQLLLDRQGRYTLGEVPTTPHGVVTRECRLTIAPVILECRQECFTARLANTCTNKLRKQHHNPCSGMPVCRAVNREHEHAPTTDAMSWPPPAKESVVRTVIKDDGSAAKCAAQQWAREKEAKVRVVVWVWWTAG